MEALWDIHRECFTPSWSWESFLKTLAGTQALVAFSEKPAGYLLAQKSGNECEILSLAVRPRFQRHGVARRLLEALIEKNTQSEGIFLEVSSSNGPAQGLYKDFGFEIFGLRRRYYGDGSNALMMKLNLAKT